MNIDPTRLRADVRALEEQIRALKLTIRTTPTPWPAPYARELRALKAAATLRYAIRAHARGRRHLLRLTRSHAHLGLPELPQMSFEDQARYIGDHWRAYAAPDQGSVRWAG